MKKRLFSLLLVVTLVAGLFSSLTLTASAAEKTYEVSSETELLHAIADIHNENDHATINVTEDFEFTEDITLENTSLVIPSDAVLTVKGQITTLGVCSVSGGGILKRGAGYEGAIINVPAQNTLTVSDITIDGGAVLNRNSSAENYNATIGYVPIPGEGSVSATAELLCNAGTTTLKSGAVLQNNYSTTNATSNANCRSAGVYNTGVLTLEQGSAIRYNVGYCPALYNTGTVNLYGEISHNFSSMTTAKQHYEQAACIYNASRLYIEDGASIDHNEVYWTLIISKYICYIRGGSISYNKCSSDDIGTIAYARNGSGIYYDGGIISYNDCAHATLSINGGANYYRGTEIAYNTGNGIMSNWVGYTCLYSGHIHDNGCNIYRPKDSRFFAYGTMNLKNDDGTESAITYEVDDAAGSIFYEYIGNKFEICPYGAKRRVVMQINPPAKGVEMSQFSLCSHSGHWSVNDMLGFTAGKGAILVGTRKTISLDLNYDGALPASVDKAYFSGAVYGDLDTPTRDGYVFNGWYTEAEGGTVVTFNTPIPSAADVTLYAHWAANPDLAYHTTATGYTGTFDGSAHSITVNSVDGATIEYKETDDGEYSAINPAYTNAGTYTVYYRVTKEGCTTFESSATVTINKIGLGNWGQDRVYTYTGSPLTRNTSPMMERYFNLSGDISKTEPGEYKLILTVKPEYQGNLKWGLDPDITNPASSSYPWSANAGSALGQHEDENEMVLRWAISVVETVVQDVTLTFAHGADDQTTALTAGTYTNAASSDPDVMPITYTSSKPDVATVDESGVVTLLNPGTVKITASYAGNEDYNAASAHYWLIITSNEVEEHVIETIAAVPATCEDDGNTEGKACAVCGQVFEGNTVVPALGHDYAYSASDNVITGTCSRDASHVITATINAPSSVGGEATIVYSENWPADAQSLPLSYTGNDAVKTACTTYEGVAANVAYVMVDTDDNGTADAVVTAADTGDNNICKDASNNTYIPVDINSDGVADVYVKAADADGDGIYEDAGGNTYIAVDTDNDRVVDGYLKASDADGDGIYTDVNGNRFADSNNDKIYTPYTSAPSGGSSSKPNVVVTNEEGGRVTASSNGTVTITPNKGYEIDKVTVNGKEVNVPANGKLTGLKPTDKVVVTFKSDDASGSKKFIDVSDNAYYANAVEWAASKGITEGTTPVTFSPDAPCTRAQAVTFLWRAAGCPEPKGNASVFADIPVNSYYEKAVAWAIENGITKGTTDTTFSPDTIASRAHVVTFLYRYEKALETGTVNPFVDVADRDYYYNPVMWAVENNITSGTTETTFSPVQHCTRAQFVTFLYRDMNN